MELAFGGSDSSSLVLDPFQQNPVVMNAPVPNDPDSCLRAFEVYRLAITGPSGFETPEGA